VPALYGGGSDRVHLPELEHPMIGIGWRVPTGHPAIPSHPTNLPRLMNAQLPPLAPGHGPGPPRVRGSMIITLAAEGRARGGG
jgi:hypothetical protein